MKGRLSVVILVTTTFAASVIDLISGNRASAITYQAIDLDLGFGGSQAEGAAGGQQVGGSVTADGQYHAMIWNGAAANYVDLNPTGYLGSYCQGTDGTHQVGSGDGHAMLWTGTAASAIDLNPDGFDSSNALGICGNEQVGIVYVPIPENLVGAHAALWHGTALSAVDLHPTGWVYSEARATDGKRQVGGGRVDLEGEEHALRWSGTASSLEDLNPSEFTFSFAFGIHGTQVVGAGGNGNGIHALLWDGTDVVDLNPSGYYTSCARSTNGAQQVGSANNHAMVWSGTADSAIDLNQFLAFGVTDAYANAIDAQGNIVGCVTDELGHLHAILWVPVPEPSTIDLLAIAAFGVLMRRWRG